jgi:hypothetical protein
MTNPDDKLPYHCKSIGDSEVIRKPMTVHDWWPDTLNLWILHQDPITMHPSHILHPSCLGLMGMEVATQATFVSYH